MLGFSSCIYKKNQISNNFELKSQIKLLAQVWISLEFYFMLKRWTRGLGEECATFFQKGAKSNPVTNFERKREKPARENRSNLETKQKRHARKRPVTRERARTRRLDPKLRGKKRLDSKDVNVNWTTIWRMKHEAFKKKSCSKKQGSWRLISIECYTSSWSKERWREYIYIFKCVYDVAGYHWKRCKCVLSNKGLQKPLI